MTTRSIKNSKSSLVRAAIATLTLAVSATAQAAPSAEELGKLGLEGTELTPAGRFGQVMPRGQFPRGKTRLSRYLQASKQVHSTQTPLPATKYYSPLTLATIRIMQIS